MDWLYRVLYYFYTFIVHLGWMCRRNIVSYHLVDSFGQQYCLTETNLQFFDHLLVIYYTPNGTRYRFQRLQQPLSSYTVPMLKSAFKNFTEPNQHKLFAVNATIHDHVYTINAIEFNVVGNEIFTPTFNLWLCRNYLHIPPSEVVDVSYIDHTMSVCFTKETILIDEDTLRIGNSHETVAEEK